MIKKLPEMNLTSCKCCKMNPDFTRELLTGDTNDNKTKMEPEDVSKMGCPCLGEHTKLEVVIEESYEFKVKL